MAPQIGGRGGDNADKYKNATNVKDLLDMIGKDVHDKVKEEAKNYIGELKAGVSFASIFGEETVSTNDPCQLIEDKGDELLGAHGDPCKKDGKGNDVDRFSDKDGAECGNSKIHGNSKGGTGTEVGACAPYRRLSLCSKNFPNMNSNDSSKAKHDLLAEVCYAAKYEGESITQNHGKYQLSYPGSQICTMLARSFADIGDIIRGKDLYLGNNKKDKLQDNLKKIFKKIHSDVTSTSGRTNGKNVDALKTRYKDNDENFYRLREDWWTANRETVWKALTCSKELDNSSYFHATCIDGKSQSQANKHCRCNGDQPGNDKPNTDPPTYFDYVPQFLRWFEEWAEDFCRKKNKKLKDVKTNCRGPSGNDKYCSRNGYDCEKTIRKIELLRMGNQCTKCLFACNPYVDWINNQKEQFDKQKNKYADEINGTSTSSRKKRDAGSSGNNSNYDGYESKFYKILKDDYETVDAFLEKLSKENVCTKITDEKEGKIDFKTVKSSGASGDSGTNDENKGTFYRSKYCQPCPICGVKKKDGGSGKKWEEKDKSEQCTSINLYKPTSSAEGTKIEILKSGDEATEIAEKLKKFCAQINRGTTNNGGNGTGGGAGGSGGNSEKKELYDEWKCYEIDELTKVGEGEDDHDYDKDVEKGGGLCILEKTNGEENGKKQKTFHDFFYYWVAHMLKDSIHWRTKKIKGCLEKKNGNTCKKNNCKDNCGCFQKWVEQKETEWKPIKQQFSKQKITGNEGGFIEFNHDDLLKQVLELEFSNENTEQDKKNNVSAEEAKEIKHLREMLQKENAQQTAGANGKKNIMDKLIEHELTDAKECIEKHNKCPPKPASPAEEGGGGGGAGRSRSETGKTTTLKDNENVTNLDNEEDDDSEEDENEDEEEEEEEEEEAAETVAEVTEVKPPCDIVDELFKETDTLKQACSTKYEYGREKFPNWKCIPSGKPSDTTGSSDATTGGSVCIPPRRRRLYVGKLHDWATKAVSPQGATALPQGEDAASPSNSRDGLRDAFIESAAVETFFLWDRYKKQKEKKPQGEGAGGLGGAAQLLSPQQPGPESDDNNPQSKLQQTGVIPPDFLRQMFYTLADYRDICVGNTPNGIDKVSASDQKDKGANSKLTIQQISEKIKENLSKQPGVLPQNSGKDPESWWNENAKHIWHGMLCALTYKDNDAKGGNPTVDEQVEKAFFGTPNGKPSIPPGLPNTQNGTFEEKYKYDQVKLEEESSGPKTSGDTQLPTLKEFISRPTYFRYLEEWGESFCRERRRRLKDIKYECLGEHEGGGRTTNCSGDGFECTKTGPNKDKIFNGLDCPGCAISCRKYKKWIERKKIEFGEQKSAYGDQKTKCKEESGGGDNGFCGKLTKCTDAAKFLNSLKNGPCKKDNDSEEDNKGKGYIDFNNEGEAFGHENYCDPCSEFTVKCNNRVCSGTNVSCNGGKINAKNIGNGVNSTVIDMLVSDKSGNELKNGLNVCIDAGIFKGFRKDEWKCHKFCDVDVCGLKKGDNNGKLDDKQIILISALFKRWVENFVEDYNKINEKLKPCINKNKESTFQNKCNCVEIWTEKKKDEWETIRDRYMEPYESETSPIYFNVKSFLEPLQHQTAFKKAIKPCKDLNAFEDSSHCNGADSSKSAEDGKERDVVECLLEKLKKKANECKDLPSDTECSQEQTLEDDETFDDDIETEEAKKNMMPTICKDVVPTEEQEDEHACKPAAPQPDVKEEEEEKEEEKDKAQPGEPPPAPAVPPAVEPPQADEPFNRDILEKTIPFGIALALGSIAFLFLKKKTKSSVGNLFQILQIPKSDYDIPTLKSKNRYIPYRSGTYKGKTYIYMEGDSSGDEKYAFMSDTTDITSSESEYEELDINDIYVPGSPKYKTLIEVVLEPSKRDIPSGDIPNNDTPSSKITDNEWNTLKDDFISQYLQSEQPNGVPNDYSSGDIPLNTQPNILYFDKSEERPFITSIHDRNLYTGEEYNYNVNMVNNDDIPISGTKDTYSGIDLINDSLNSNKVDIYDEVLKRKENELFGTNHVKQTSIHSVAKPTNNDPIHNQLELFHKWLDRHRNMCEQWDKNKKEELLDKLKKEWNKENNNNSGDINNRYENVLNTDVSIQIDMNDPKPINQYTNMYTNSDNSTMDNISNDMEKHREPYFYDIYEDDITYFDIDDEKTPMGDINVDHNNVNSNNMDVPNKVHIEMNIVNNKKEVLEEEYPISDIWNI
ncbi:hypothetical protein PFNF135_00816 [Plasmodium falciparum NF135/5.C10]|uniref:Erythrocyte membrane protein 1 n=1 Tax=Plasmodium falciparum NF135/5.C10 TaxID=1036726 RepID=W4INQ9_PLAFA|nr:hypothetical protein PFNF135_00816 [Plasmodium falciparum NF135/5.C10]